MARSIANGTREIMFYDNSRLAARNLLEHVCGGDELSSASRVSIASSMYSPVYFIIQNLRAL